MQQKVWNLLKKEAIKKAVEWNVSSSLTRATRNNLSAHPRWFFKRITTSRIIATWGLCQALPSLSPLLLPPPSMLSSGSEGWLKSWGVLLSRAQETQMSSSTHTTQSQQANKGPHKERHWRNAAGKAFQRQTPTWVLMNSLSPFASHALPQQGLWSALSPWDL